MRKGISLLAIIILIITGCQGYPGIEVDEVDSREIYTNTSDFEIHVSDELGKMYVEYNGDKARCGIVIEREGGWGSNTYIIERGQPEIISFTYGEGDYTLKLCELTPDNKLKVIEKGLIDIGIKQEHAPFVGVSYYTSYGTEIEDIVESLRTKEVMETVEDTYEFVKDYIEYNTDLADIINSGEIEIYRPNVQKVVDEGKGICLDQAALMATILRQLEIPTRIVMGYDNYSNYHAWVDVLIDGDWSLYDPTHGKTFRDEESSKYKALKYY